MKKITLVLLSFLFVVGLVAQKEAKKYDVILKTNGEELTGEVKEVSPDLIKFVYKGEKLVYEIKKSDIFRITYASGRSEILTKPGEAAPEKPKTSNPEPAPTQPAAPVATTPAANPVDHHNKIAILPFTFLRDNQSMGDDMAYQVQEEVYAYIKKHNSIYTIVDPQTTNALLIKAGVTRDKIKGYTMAELCDIVGVEYIVEGTIKQNKGTATSYSSDNYKSKSDGESNNKKVSGTSYTTSSQPYSSNVTLNVFTDKGENKYSQNRTGLIANDQGAYDSPLDYLLKRLPFYSK